LLSATLSSVKFGEKLIGEVRVNSVLGMFK
jgi:hypothetical protein